MLSRFAVPTKHGWCEHNIIKKESLEVVIVAALEITNNDLTRTSVDRRCGIWESNEFSVSLQPKRLHHISIKIEEKVGTRGTSWITIIDYDGRK